MAIRLTTDLIVDLGYGSLTESQAKQLLEEIYNTGELLVGTKLANQMSNAQLEQFEHFIDSVDESGALAWLERNMPDYKETVAMTFEEMYSSLRELAAKNARRKEDGIVVDSEETQEI